MAKKETTSGRSNTTVNYDNLNYDSQIYLERRTRRIFKTVLIRVLLANAVLLFSTTLFITLLDMWIMFCKLLTLIRVFILIYVIIHIQDVIVPEMNIVKVNGILSVLRGLSNYRPMGVWFIIGIVDNFLIRIPILLIDVLYILMVQKGVIHFIFVFPVMVMDILFIYEFYYSMKMVYKFGVIKNIRLCLREIKTRYSDEV